MKRFSKNMSAAIKAAVEKTVKDLRTSRVGMERSLDAAVGFYRSKVEESLEYPEDLFKSKLKSLGGELKGDDILAVNMRKAHELYARHVNMARAGKQGQLTRAYLIKDILPDNLREGLQ